MNKNKPITTKAAAAPEAPQLDTMVQFDAYENIEGNLRKVTRNTKWLTDLEADAWISANKHKATKENLRKVKRQWPIEGTQSAAAPEAPRKCRTCGFDISEYAQGSTLCAACDEELAQWQSKRTPAPEAPRETYTTSNQHDNDAWANAVYAGFASPEEHDAATLTAAPEAPRTIAEKVYAAIQDDADNRSTLEILRSYLDTRPTPQDHIRDLHDAATRFEDRAKRAEATAAKLAEALREALTVKRDLRCSNGMFQSNVIRAALAEWEKGAH
jgi:hypothetical protein